MKVVRTLADLRTIRPALGSVGFVPTMGAFHDGHLALMTEARRHADTVVVSLFVNPTQFGPNEDLSKYPRQEARDLELAESVDVGVVYAPSASEMYADNLTTITVSHVSQDWEGAIRPGHFSGVATVVAKLFNHVQPTVAVFGWKDLQQCAVVRQLVRDLGFNLELRFLETVREADGLAMSSRNAFLSSDQRALAGHFPRILREVVSKVPPNVSRSTISLLLDNAVSELENLGIEVNYLTVVNGTDMQVESRITNNSRIMSAIRIGTTRLLDNMPFR